MQLNETSWNWMKACFTKSRPYCKRLHDIVLYLKSITTVLQIVLFIYLLLYFGIQVAICMIIMFCSELTRFE